MGNPIINCSVRDINQLTLNLTGNDQVLVRHFSTAEATMTATAEDGATIDMDMFIIRNGGETVYGSTGTFKEVLSKNFVFSAADSKGRASQVTKTMSMVEYIKLTCNSHKEKISANGTVSLSCGGDYFNGSFGAKANTLTVTVRYKPNGGSWSSEYTMNVTKSGNSYTATLTLSGLDPKKMYEFQFLAQDRLTQGYEETGNISSTPVFSWSKSDVAFEVPVLVNDDLEVVGEAKFAYDVEMGGNLDIGTADFPASLTVTNNAQIYGELRLRNGTKNYGNKLYFGDGGYCCISESSDDNMTIHASGIYLESDKLYHNGQEAALPVYGTWTPELTIEDANYYTQKGWFSKVGDVVTVGFYVKAYCYSGYEDVRIVINGLPYEPLYEASGGGICSGAFISSNKNFQCFVAETDGYITLRAQACDDTDDTNLSTSATACFYPANTTLTLSGTITYTI